MIFYTTCRIWNEVHNSIRYCKNTSKSRMWGPSYIWVPDARWIYWPEWVHKNLDSGASGWLKDYFLVEYCLDVRKTVPVDSWKVLLLQKKPKDFTHESRLEDDHYSTVWAVWCDMTDSHTNFCAMINIISVACNSNTMVCAASEDFGWRNRWLEKNLNMHRFLFWRR